MFFRVLTKVVNDIKEFAIVMAIILGLYLVCCPIIIAVIVFLGYVTCLIHPISPVDKNVFSSYMANGIIVFGVLTGIYLLWLYFTQILKDIKKED
jgi:hypothetical protein